MICVLDNYDSFVYNLVQYLGTLGASCQVYRNDEISVTDVEALAPELVLISPGPGDPADAGISVELVRRLAGRVPILGVCLGHQAIGAAFGARVVHAAEPMHGKCSAVAHDGSGVFAGLPNPLTVARYHSLVLDPASLPAELAVTALSDTGEIMAIRHRRHAIEGVQFHPESLFTQEGVGMVANAVRGLLGSGELGRNDRRQFAQPVEQGLGLVGGQ
ncbi:anthranilate synthase component II [Amycolatopsis camponoti]|uniref:anthranilate synthase component II n=1 Tax=Amycolatopsis camponoti TaxID=2606593 RepID=UPI0012D77C80|nr:aminodeoxychorismate/anthranilate synthase component II [Amycolatopsis camponoti]